MNLALLVIDIQKAFFDQYPPLTDSLNDAVEYINAAIELFRAADLPVVCIQHMNDDLQPGTEGFDLPESLKILESDLHIHKRYGNSFNKTELGDRLREMGVDTVLVTGFCAEYCVLSTYRGAGDQDFKPIILRGALASDNRDHIRFVEDISDTLTLGVLKKILE